MYISHGTLTHRHTHSIKEQNEEVFHGCLHGNLDLCLALNCSTTWSRLWSWFTCARRRRSVTVVVVHWVLGDSYLACVYVMWCDCGIEQSCLFIRLIKLTELVKLSKLMSSWAAPLAAGYATEPLFSSWSDRTVRHWTLVVSNARLVTKGWLGLRDTCPQTSGWLMQYPNFESLLKKEFLLNGILKLSWYLVGLSKYTFF